MLGVIFNTPALVWSWLKVALVSDKVVNLLPVINPKSSPSVFAHIWFTWDALDLPFVKINFLSIRISEVSTFLPT